MVKALRTSLRYGGLRQGGLQPGLGNDDIFATASLDLNFAVNKNLGTLVDATTGTNLVTFSRASSGTYVGSDGLIKTATTNLLLWSEKFDDASWVDPTITWTASAVAAPNGTLTVLKPNRTWTFWAFYNQTKPEWIDGYPEAFPFTVTNQWARQSVQITAPVGCTTLRFYPGRVGVAGDYFYQAVTVIPGETYTASAYYKLDTDGTVLIWGPQLEQSSTVTEVLLTEDSFRLLYEDGTSIYLKGNVDFVGEYIKTTSTINSAPRFDHNPTTGESLGLLVEEQRSNLLLNSGTLSTQSVTVTAVDHALSFTGTGTVTLSGASTAGPLVGTGTSEANRVSLTFTPTAGSLTLTVSGTVTDAQLEAGSPPTSYIPTKGTTFTRAASLADLINSAIANNIRSFYVEFRSPASGTCGVVSLNDSTANERAAVLTSGTDPKLVVVDGGTTQADIDAGTVTAGIRTRIAVRIGANDFAISINGGAVVTDTSGTLPTMDRLMIGRTQAGEYLNGTIARYTGWTESLADSTLQSLTQ